MKRIYSIDAGNLQIKDAESAAVVWQGHLEGATVYKILPLPAADGCLVLLDPGASKKPTFENLLLVDSNGRIRWKAQLPRSHDAFVDVVLTSAGVEARTWYGIRVSVDVGTGHSKEIGFSK